MSLSSDHIKCESMPFSHENEVLAGRYLSRIHVAHDYDVNFTRWKKNQCLFFDGPRIVGLNLVSSPEVLDWVKS